MANLGAFGAYGGARVLQEEASQQGWARRGVVLHRMHDTFHPRAGGAPGELGYTKSGTARDLWVGE